MVGPLMVPGKVGKIIETYAARCLQPGGPRGYHDSSVSDITHGVCAMTLGTHAAPCGKWPRMSDLVDLTSRLLDDGFVICTEKTGERFTVLLRRTRAEGRRVFCGTGDNFPDALVDAAEEAAVPAA